MTRLRSSTPAIARRGMFHLSPQITKLLSRGHVDQAKGDPRWRRQY